MSEMQGTLFEFDQDNELHRKAQHYIKTMDREKFPSFGDLMVTAIVDYFDRYYEQESEEAEGAPELDARIEAAVERALERKLPEVLRSMDLVAGDGDGKATEAGSEEPAEETAEPIDLEAVKKDINWGFLGG